MPLQSAVDRSDRSHAECDCNLVLGEALVAEVGCHCRQKIGATREREACECGSVPDDALEFWSQLSKLLEDLYVLPRSEPIVWVSRPDAV